MLRLLPAQPALRVRTTREPDLFEGKAAPGRFELYVDGTCCRNRRPYMTPMILNPGALTCEMEPWLVDHDRLNRPLPLTKRSTASPST